MSSDELNMGNMQVPIVFLMTLSLLSNFSGQLLSCDVQSLFDTNMYAKHLLGLMTMMFFNILSDPVNAENIGRSIGEAVALYLWFVMLTRTHIVVAVLIVGLMFTIYVLDVRRKRAEKSGDESVRMADLKRADVILKWVTLGATFAGVIHYLVLKKMEYGDEFDVLTFFVGQTKCKRN